MKLCTYRNAVAFLLLLLLSTGAHAQKMMWRIDPDSLQTVTVSGKIIVDSTASNVSRYYLDIDGNGTRDYILSFGPAWYKPDSSTALRPANGQQVTIKGGQTSTAVLDSLKMIIVYEINGAFWRDPFDSDWNNLGRYSHMGDHMMDSCLGNAYGFMHDSIKSVTLKGRILVDTTFIYEMTYLDTSKVDTSKTRKPDFFLNLGPYWYQPADSTVKRPGNGDSVTITGGFLARTPMKVVIVYTINGKLWRDSTTVGKTLGGGWVNKGTKKETKFHSAFDSTTWISISPNWHSQMGGGMMMPDSIYGQILEVLPGSIPNRGNEKVLAGYEIGIFTNNGMNMMRQNASCGGHIRFNSPAIMQLHFTGNQLERGRFNKKTIKVKYWNDSTKSWVTVDNAKINTAKNTVTFSQNIVSSYVILSAETATGVELIKNFTPESYTLTQNYPNPFNPSTFITYEIPKAGIVTLKIYDILGRQVAQLVNENQMPGKYSVSFNAQDLPSGIYIYQLRANDFQMSKKMTLLK
ncbi:MAG TPA: T9SS type A sorting domain-containing protein [Ignavibacteriales bacterium]|nr:T9SS type A sorting domain-containing protein [Ignavibacteriales bacterium]